MRPLSNINMLATDFHAHSQERSRKQMIIIWWPPGLEGMVRIIKSYVASCTRKTNSILDYHGFGMEELVGNPWGFSEFLSCLLSKRRLEA